MLANLFLKNDTLILCGGSGLYVKAVCEGFDEVPTVPDGLREKIILGYQTNGLLWLQQQVKQYDPNYFEVVDKKNSQRLMRALEINLGTNKNVENFRTKKKQEHNFEIVKIGLEIERQELYSRIDRRMDAMIETGLFEEAQKLYAHKKYNALQTVGYREIFGYLDGQYDKAEAIRLLKRNSRHYAKRQLTWFKNDAAVNWVNTEQEALQLIGDKLND